MGPPKPLNRPTVCSIRSLRRPIVTTAGVAPADNLTAFLAPVPAPFRAVANLVAHLEVTS